MMYEPKDEKVFTSYGEVDQPGAQQPLWMSHSLGWNLHPFFSLSCYFVIPFYMPIICLDTYLFFSFGNYLLAFDEESEGVTSFHQLKGAPQCL